MAEISRRKTLALLVSAAASAIVAKVVVTGGGSPPGVTRGRGQRTSFGSVALLGSARLALAPPAAAGHGHHAAASSVPVPSAVHGAWTDAVMVDVEVHNGAADAMQLSPGQFRVRVDDGPTVSLYSADRPAGPVDGGSTTTMQISYLVPPQRRALSLEFADAGAMSTLRLGRLDEPEAQS